MSYEVTLLVFGILLLLVGLIGKVKAQQLEVGTDNLLARGVTAMVGLVLLVLSLNPDMARSLLPGSKTANAPVADATEKPPAGTKVPAGPNRPPAGLPAAPKPVDRPPAPPAEPRPAPMGNGFRDLNVTGVTASEVRVTVVYTYNGDLGENPPIVPTVRANGTASDAMVYEPISGRARTGTGRASWTIYGDLARPWESDELKFCIVDTSRAKPPFCQSLPHRRQWAVPARQAVTDNLISGLLAQDVSSKELRVTVAYRYAGESGRRPFRVYMSAVALQSDNRQVPRTHFEGLGGPGAVRLGTGRSTMLITKYSDDDAISESIRVCINSQNAAGNLTTVLCKDFPHHKDWR